MDERVRWRRDQHGQAVDDQTNAKGGLLGRKLKWIEGDTKTDRTEAAKVGQNLIDEGAELLFVSCDYDFGAPAALKAEAAGVISVFLLRVRS